MPIDRHPVVAKTLAIQQAWNQLSDDIVTVISQKKSMEDEYMKRRMDSILHNVKELESEKTKLAANATFLGISNKKWKNIGPYVSGSIAVGNGIGLGLTIYTAKHQNETSNNSIPPSTIAVQVATAVLALGSFVILTGWNCFDSKRQESSKALEQEAERATTMRLFFETYNEFLKQKNQPVATPQYEENTTTKLRQCLFQLEKVPEDTVPKKTRTLLLSAMIQELPEKHPVKLKLVQTHQLAREISRYSSNSDIKMPAIPTTITPPSLPIQAPESQTNAPHVPLTLPVAIKRDSSETADQVIDLDRPIQLKKNYSQLFTEMQQQLGIQIDELAYGQNYFNEDAELSPISSKKTEENKEEKQQITSASANSRSPSPETMHV